MKKYLIIILIVMLTITGCATDKPLSTEPETPKEVENIEEPLDTVAEEPIISEEPTTGEDPVMTEEAVGTEAPATTEVPATTEDPATTEEPLIIEEELAQEETEELQKDENNILKIEGLVENQLKLPLHELKTLNDIIFEADFYSLNSFGTTGYTHFKGVKLWDLLEQNALIKAEASKVSIVAQDGYSMEFTLDQVKMDYMDETNPDTKYPMIIAWEENGEEYSTDEGAPYKLVVGQKEPGDVNKPQWVSNIDVIIIE